MTESPPPGPWMPQAWPDSKPEVDVEAEGPAAGVPVAGVPAAEVPPGRAPAGRAEAPRRQFLVGATAAAGVLGAGRMRLGGHPDASRRPGPTPARVLGRVDVAIAGGGLAGLVAARALVRAGHSVVVLEARHRVGGRMVRQPVIEGDTRISAASGSARPRPPSSPSPMSWVYGGSPRITTGARSSTTRGSAARSRAVSRRSGRAARRVLRELRDAKQALAKIDRLSAEVPIRAPWRAPHARRQDSETLASWLGRNTSTSFGRFVITQQALIGGTCAFEPADVSFLHVLFANAAAPQAQDPETDLFYGAAGDPACHRQRARPPGRAALAGTGHRARPVRGADDHGRGQLRGPVRDRGHAAVLCRADLLRPRSPGPASPAGPAHPDGLAAQGARCLPPRVLA